MVKMLKAVVRAPWTASVDERRNNVSIDTLRGVAVLLMVLGHVIGDTSRAGLKVPDDSLARYSYFAAEYLRMPLFTVLSGFVFAMRPASMQGGRRFFLSKARRLLVPLVVVSTIYALIKMRMEPSGEPVADQLQNLWRVWVFPYDHFWFLQSILVTLTIFGVLDLLGCFRGVTRTVVTLVSASAIATAMPWLGDFFSFPRAMTLLPFFALGVFLQRFGDAIRHPGIVIGIGIIFVAAFGFQQWTWFAGREDLQTTFLRLAVGISGCTLLVLSRVRWSPLAYLGTFAYTIYLYHIFFTSAARRALSMVGVESVLLHCIFGIAAAVAGCIAVHQVASLTPLTRVCLLGLRPKKKAAVAGDVAVRVGSLQHADQ